MLAQSLSSFAGCFWGGADVGRPARSRIKFGTGASTSLQPHTPHIGATGSKDEVRGGQIILGHAGKEDRGGAKSDNHAIVALR